MTAVAADPELTSLEAALDPATAERHFGRKLPRLAGRDGFVRVRNVRLARYKPARRCVVEYDVDVERPGRPPERVTLLGKIRRRRSGRSSYRLLDAFWNMGFNADAEDAIAVPEPIAVVPELRVWLQRKVSGRVATDLLAAPDAEVLARRIAEAAHKVHRAGVPAPHGRRHTMADELRILHECLPHVALIEGHSRERIERLLDACDRLGSASPNSPPRWIHRDFYGDQVIVDGDRLYLIDFDQYCEGDPAVDVGNFLGCTAEYSLRTFGDPDALEHVGRALEDAYLEQSVGVRREAIRAYMLLTLVRHVYICTRIPGRHRFTADLLSLCEERFDLVGGGRRRPRR